MKKSIYHLAAVLTVLTLAACGNKKEVEPIESPLPELPPELKIINLQGISWAEAQEAIEGKWEYLSGCKWYYDHDKKESVCTDDFVVYPDIRYCTFNFDYELNLIAKDNDENIIFKRELDNAFFDNNLPAHVYKCKNGNTIILHANSNMDLYDYYHRYGLASIRCRNGDNIILEDKNGNMVAECSSIVLEEAFGNIIIEHKDDRQSAYNFFADVQMICVIDPCPEVKKIAINTSYVYDISYDVFFECYFDKIQQDTLFVLSEKNGIIHKLIKTN